MRAKKDEKNALAAIKNVEKLATNRKKHKKLDFFKIFVIMSANSC